MLAYAFRDLVLLDTAVPKVERVEGMFFEPRDSNPQFILGLAVFLIYGRRYRIQAAMRNSGSIVPAALLFAASIAWFAWAQYVQAPDLGIFSLQAGLLGVGFLLGGAPVARILVTPALFLLLAIPLPGVVVNQLIWPMQMWTVEISRWMLGVIGIVVHVSGDLMFTPPRVFQVIESCSGLRSVETLLMAAFIYRELLSRGRLQGVLVLMCAPFVAFALNGIRVVTIVVNPTSDVSSTHLLQGLIAIVAGVLVLAAIGGLLAIVLPRPARGVWSSRPHELPALGRLRSALLAAVAAILVLMSVGLPAWQEPPRSGKGVYTVPARIGPWRGVVREIDTTFLGSLGFSEFLNRTYTHKKNEETLELFLALDNRLDRGRSLLSDKNAYPTSGWQRSGAPVPTLTIGGRASEGMLLRKGDRWLLSYHLYAGVGTALREAVWGTFGLDRGPGRRTLKAATLRITTETRPDEDAIAAGVERLQGFVEGLDPHLRELDPWEADWPSSPETS